MKDERKEVEFVQLGTNPLAGVLTLKGNPQLYPIRKQKQNEVRPKGPIEGFLTGW